MPGRDRTRWVEQPDGSYARAQDVPDAVAEPAVAPTETAEPAEAPTDETGGEEAEEATVSADHPPATPSAVEAAAELGVNLTDVTGTGYEGRITKADVESTAEAADSA